MSRTRSRNTKLTMVILEKVKRIADEVRRVSRNRVESQNKVPGKKTHFDNQQCSGGDSTTPEVKLLNHIENNNKAFCNQMKPDELTAICSRKEIIETSNQEADAACCLRWRLGVKETDSFLKTKALHFQTNQWVIQNAVLLTWKKVRT